MMFLDRKSVDQTDGYLRARRFLSYPAMTRAFSVTAALALIMGASTAHAQNFEPTLPQDSCEVTYAAWLVDGGSTRFEDRQHSHEAAFALAGWVADADALWVRDSVNPPTFPLTDFIPGPFPNNTPAYTFGSIPPNTAFGDISLENDTSFVEAVLLITKVTATNSDRRTVTIVDTGGLEAQTMAAFDDAGNVISDTVIRTNGRTSVSGTYTLDVDVPASGEFFIYVWKVDVDQGSGTGVAECGSDLVTTKVSSSPAIVSVGDTVTFDITVENLGPEEAQNIRLADLLPAGLSPTAINGTTNTGTYNSATGEWTFDTLADGATATLTIEGIVDPEATGLTIANTVTAAESEQAPLSLAGDVLTASVAVPPPSLSMTKAADNPGPYTAGDVVTYKYTVINDGETVIRDIAITDTHNGADPAPVPGNETLLTDAGTQGDSTDAAIDGSWDVLAPGDVLTFTGTYTITQTDAETL